MAAFKGVEGRVGATLCELEPHHQPVGALVEFVAAQEFFGDLQGRLGFARVLEFKGACAQRPPVKLVDESAFQVEPLFKSGVYLGVKAVKQMRFRRCRRDPRPAKAGAPRRKPPPRAASRTPPSWFVLGRRAADRPGETICPRREASGSP